MKRFVFAVGSAAGKPLAATKKDAASVYTVLVTDTIGACHLASPPPLYNCIQVADFDANLNQILREWDEDDQLIFYYSGHGSLEKGQYCLVLGNSTVDLLPFDNLMARLSLCNVKKAILILDACGAGHAAKTNDSKPPEHCPPLHPDVTDTTIPPGMAIIASSGPAQWSWQNQQGDASIFTEAFCHVLRTGIPNQEAFLDVQDVVVEVSAILRDDDKYAEYKQDPLFVVRGTQKIWIAKNLACKDDSDETIPAEANSVYSPSDLELLAERKLTEEHPSRLGAIEDIDLDLINEYSASVHKGSTVDRKERTVTEADLEYLGLLSPVIVKGRRLLHRSAALCFCREPERVHPEALSFFLDFTVSQGEFVRREIGGPIIRQFSTFMRMVSGKLERISSIATSGQREERSEIDTELIREILSNAFAHRDFSVNGSVEVRLSRDWLEISNPGSLLDGQNFDLVLEKTFRSLPRNPILLLFMNRLRLTDQIGRGFELIRKYRQRHGLDSVQCHESTGPITVIRIQRTVENNVSPSRSVSKRTLNKLDFATVDASQETDFLFAKGGFVETPSFTQLLNSNSQLVVGRKGSGKTAHRLAISRFASRQPPIKLEITLDDFATGVFFEYIRQIQQVVLISNIPLIRNLWRHFIVVRLMHATVNNSRILELARADGLSNEVTSIEAYLDNAFGTARKIEKLSLLDIARVQVDNAASLQSRQEAEGTVTTSFPIDSEFLAAEATLRIVLKAAGGALVVIDDLDSCLGDFTFDEFQCVIEGLVHALPELSRDHYQQSNVQVKAFIPEDVYRTITFRHLDKMAHSVMWLNWTASNLTELIARRIATNLKLIPKEFGPETIRQMLGKLFPGWPQSFQVTDYWGVQRNPVEYVLMHTHYRPRDVLSLVNHIIRAAREREGSDQLQPEDVTRGVQMGTVDHVNNLVREYGGRIPHLKEVLNSLQGKQAILRYGVFCKILDGMSVEGSFLKAEEVSRLAENLYEIGIFGRLSNRAVTISESTRMGLNEQRRVAIFSFAAPEALLSTNDDVLIHPVFWRYLNMSAPNQLINELVEP
ncbi:MAG: hypothetical protein DHS20C16_24360 [Phycisphaerae bacterium]|nr:MAG: hypothetical protein DHS20C16_24360 [Phycisphaerae bacterium]